MNLPGRTISHISVRLRRGYPPGRERLGDVRGCGGKDAPGTVGGVTVDGIR